MPRKGPPHNRPGFSLTELLVVLVVFGLCGALLAQEVQKVREAANRAVSNNNLKQIALATLNCNDTFRKLPSAVGRYFPTNNPMIPNNGYGPIFFHLLPYLEQDPVYKSTLAPVGNVVLYGSWNASGTVVKVFLAPGDSTLPPSGGDRSSYLANSLALPYGGSSIPASFTDGTSQTILYAEGYSLVQDVFAHGGQTITKPVERRWWEDTTWDPAPSGVTFQVAPDASAASVRLPQGHFAGGIQVAMADAGTRMVAPTCSATTFFAACTPNGGEPLGEDW